jgi:pimeloyl-ACP methyl ester carboxylesterase
MMRQVSMALLGLGLFLSNCARADELCLQVDATHRVGGILEFPVKDAGTVALIVPGTHVDDRNGPVDPAIEREGLYAGLARVLRDQGMAVARLDASITVNEGSRTGCANGVGTVNRSIDAQRKAFAAAAAYLRHLESGKRFRRVILIGHSQGGIIGAQILAQDPTLADEFYIAGTSLRPWKQMTLSMGVNMPMSALGSLVGSRPGSCIGNAELVAHRAELETLFRPLDRFWLSPRGRWCRGDLAELESRFLAAMKASEQSSKACNPMSTSGTIGEIGNTCSELQLFFSDTSLVELLAHYRGKVGVAFGIRDTHFLLGPEGDAFRSLASAAGNREIILLDMGHVFGDHPYLGPTVEGRLREFAGFVAGKRNKAPRLIKMPFSITERQ